MLSKTSQEDQAILMPLVQRDVNGRFYGFLDQKTIMFHDGRPSSGSSTSGLALCQGMTEKQCKIKLRIKVEDLKRVLSERGFLVKVEPVQVISRRRIVVTPTTDI